MTTGDELLLLAIVPGRQRIRIRSEDRLRYALRTSELADLCLAGRIAVGRRQIEVLDTRPVEDRRLSSVLQGLGAAAPPPGLKDWLRRTPRSLTVEYLSRLEDQKVVRVRRWRDSSGRTRNDILSVDLPRRQALLTRLDTMVRSGSARSTADLTLALLARPRAWPLPPTLDCAASPTAAEWPPSPQRTVPPPQPPERSRSPTRNSLRH
ncbi:GPP34 family phosphoprotein [Streptomyces sp. NPDC102437]|uniref:GOLPH3/VPS74 family protein n=1 Tax=Streptomyces sp. NPDC102437 TaxID=3366175 RepID=UPI00380D5D31